MKAVFSGATSISDGTFLMAMYDDPNPESSEYIFCFHSCWISSNVVVHKTDILLTNTPHMDLYVWYCWHDQIKGKIYKSPVTPRTYEQGGPDQEKKAEESQRTAG